MTLWLHDPWPPFVKRWRPHAVDEESLNNSPRGEFPHSHVGRWNPSQSKCGDLYKRNLEQYSCAVVVFQTWPEWPECLWSTRLGASWVLHSAVWVQVLMFHFCLVGQAMEELACHPNVVVSDPVFQQQVPHTKILHLHPLCLLYLCYQVQPKYSWLQLLKFTILCELTLVSWCGRQLVNKWLQNKVPKISSSLVFISVNVGLPVGSHSQQLSIRSYLKIAANNFCAFITTSNTVIFMKQKQSQMHIIWSTTHSSLYVSLGGSHRRFPAFRWLSNARSVIPLYGKFPKVYISHSSTPNDHWT